MASQVRALGQVEDFLRKLLCSSEGTRMIPHSCHSYVFSGPGTRV